MKKFLLTLLAIVATVTVASVSYTHLVNKYNKEANCLPAGWLTATKTSDPSVANDAPFNPRSSSESELTINAPGDFEESANDGSIVFYLPEIEASGSDLSLIHILILFIT